jgi:hypothetical protein
MLQMHDELGVSIGDPKIGEILCGIMRDITDLYVPMKVDLQYGWSWGQASEEFKKCAPPSFEELINYGPSVSSKDIVNRRAA